MALITEDHLEQQPLDQVILFQAADGQVSLDGHTPRKPHVFREGQSWLLVRQGA